jgi:NodT family efflux transporter outer membrane factor (OMF) lipoprotein
MAPLQRLTAALALAAPAALSALAGCAAGPSYHRPEVHAPPGFASAPTAAATGAPPPPELASWWRALNDPELDSLIDRALQANPDLEIALAHLQQARTYEVGVIGRALPAAEASAAAGKGTGSDMTRGRASPTLLGADNSRGLTQINEIGGFDAVWELDIFGRYRREWQAAHFDARAALAARNSVLVTVIADVTRAYIDYRGLQTRTAVLHAAIKVLSESLRIANLRYQRGITNELDAMLATRELAVLEASTAPVDAQLRAAKYTIAVLLGLYPEALTAELEAPGLVPAVPSVVDPGLPVDLLRRRPDVMQAEWELAASTARIGIAITNLFPRIAITGALGYQRQALGVAPQTGAHLWSLGPAALWPLLDFGALDAEVEVADLDTRARLVNYRKVIQNAVRDVDTAASALAAERERLSKLGEALIASQRAVTLANERYVRGLTDFLNVVDAERQEFAIEAEYASAQVAQGEQFIALYRGLGGGWENYQSLPPRYLPKPAVIAALRRVLMHDDPLK